MAEIFISYKSKRRKAAAHLAKILECYGYTVWYDYSLVKGRDFAAQIDSKVRGAKTVLVLWCSMSVQSEWVADEAALAKDLGLLVPVMIEPCELRIDFRRKDYADLTAWSGGPRDHMLDQLLDALTQKIGRAPQPAYEALRAYEDVWRNLGAPSLKSFALEEPVKAGEETHRAPPPPMVHTLTPAERDWERFGIAASEDAEEIEAYIKQYEVSEPLWAVKAKKRLAAVNALLGDRAEAARAEAEARERRAEEEHQRAAAELARQEEGYRAEGRIRVQAALARPPGREWFLPGGGKTEWFKDFDIAPKMVVVPAGAFLMGSPPDEPERYDAESPQHEVTIAKPFAIGRFSVTFAEWDAAQQDKDWQAITGRAARQPKDDGWGREDRPVIDVEWDGANAYAKWLSGKTGKCYRLPTEAEWEYACRAGTTTPFWWGSSITPEQANYNGSTGPYEGGGKRGEYRQKTLPVNSFEPNPWGLYQVHGNVWEWCEDLWQDNYNGAPMDGSAWTTGGSGWHVLRGGSWYGLPRALRSAYRSGSDFVRFRNRFRGFRVARTL